MRLFHLRAKEKASSHPDWNGCTVDRRCQVWANGDEARARELAHKKFWQEATPVKADQTSPWTDPEMVTCEEADILPGMPVPAEEAVLSWDDRLFPQIANQNVPVPADDMSQKNQDPTKKLDQH